MNLIVFCRGTHGTRHFALSPVLLAGLALSVLGLLAASFGMGYGVARVRGFLPTDERIVVLQEELAAQRSAVTAARDAARDRVGALAIRVGDLNANVIRLNALGSRLVEMAKLGGGEFDFSGPPALGGPDEPVTGHAVVAGLDEDLDVLAERLEQQQLQLSLLSNYLVDRKLSAEINPRGRPVRSGYISSFFGKRRDPFTGQPRQHRGIDFAARAGTEIIAVATGIVTWSGPRQGYGRMVEINHGNGYITRYAHNLSNLVVVGEHVQQGEAIALMGATGRATGPNLHFEVWHRGRPVDPGRFIRQSAT